MATDVFVLAMHSGVMRAGLAKTLFDGQPSHLSH